MQNRHEPSDPFVERLGAEIGAEVRRRNRESPSSSAGPRWPVFTMRNAAAVAALVLVSMIAGGAVVAATYQNENREQTRALASVYERKVQIEQLKLQAAKSQLQDTERRVSVGIVEQGVAYEARQSVIEAEAALRIAMLNLEEVQATGREPRDEVSAAATPGRDFVRERLEVSVSVAHGSLDVEKRRLQAAQRRVSLGLVQAGEVDVVRSRILELESALAALQNKIDARKLFVANKLDATLADLQVAQANAEQRLLTLRPKHELARRDVARLESLFTKGLVTQHDVALAKLRVLEIEMDLAKADVELSLVKQKIVERSGGKTGGS